MFPFPCYCREEILFINTRNIAKIHVAWNDLSLLGMWRKLLRMLKIFWVLKETTKQRDRWIPRCVEKEDRVGGCQFGGRHKTQLACTTVSNKQAHIHTLLPPSLLPHRVSWIKTYNRRCGDLLRTSMESR